MRKLLLGALALAIIAVSAPGAEVGELINKLRDKDSDVRRAAAKDLAEMGPEARPALADLIRALKDSDLFVRRYAAEAIGSIGPEARSAIPDLKKALADTRKEVQLAVVVALGKIGPESLQTLLVALKDSAVDAEVRRRAADALGSFGKDGRPAIKPLTEVLVGPASKGKEKTPKKMGNPDDIRMAVVTALGQLANAEDKDTISAVRSLLDKKQKNKELKSAASQAIKMIEGRNDK
jgi:HEAT repeat protein